MPENKELIASRKQPDIKPVKTGQIQVIEHVRDIHMYSLTGSEIDELCSEYASIDFGLFTLCIGLLVAFIIALITTQMNDKVFATFVALTFGSLLGSIFFGVRTLKRKKQAKQRAEEIKKSREI
jgi:uncharacterized protein YacL